MRGVEARDENKKMKVRGGSSSLDLLDILTAGVTFHSRADGITSEFQSVRGEEYQSLELHNVVTLSIHQHEFLLC